MEYNKGIKEAGVRDYVPANRPTPQQDAAKTAYEQQMAILREQSKKARSPGDRAKISRQMADLEGRYINSVGAGNIPAGVPSPRPGGETVLEQDSTGKVVLASDGQKYFVGLDGSRRPVRD
jgi:hypothetical protein